MNGTFQSIVCINQILRGNLLAVAGAGVAALTLGVGSFTAQKWDRPVPPALTELGRGSDLHANVFVASITALAICIPIASALITTSRGSNTLALAAAAALIACAIFEGDKYGREHAISVLVAGAAMAAWLAREGGPIRAQCIALGALFFGAWCIRTRQEVRALFVAAEYILVPWFAWMMMGLTNGSK